MKNIGVKEAAKLTDMSEDFIRDRMQKKQLPFGNVVRNRKDTGWRYIVYEENVRRWMEGRDGS